MTVASETIRILLVDDNPTNLKMLSESIRDQGWTTLIATDGESAIEQTEYAQPDLILLDVMMPGIDGFETCRQLKSNLNTFRIPVIFMTALSDSIDKVRGLDMGAVDYIVKPFQHEEVLARIKLHLKLHQLTKALEEKNDLFQQKIIQQQETEEKLQILNLELEHRVEQRTAELMQSLQQLQQTQLKLIQNEKMSALGNLVAGVAHEINNPVGFISGNLEQATLSLQDVIEHLNLYRTGKSKVDIAEHAEDIDIDYLLEDLPKMISSMKTGCDRIKQISISLRTFSRADTDHKVEANIHEGINSSLMILHHRLKASQEHPEIQVIKQYGKIPSVECFLGQLNQVFMNLLANAIDAFEEQNQGQSYAQIEANPNIITITTELSLDQQHVVIKIQDNGIGIPEEIQSKIFDHLFTTKAVGKGTGLGLSISKQIIEECHGGSLELISNSTGTTFIISIPQT
jgi:signal transduction histidine kinase